MTDNKEIKENIKAENQLSSKNLLLKTNSDNAIKIMKIRRIVMKKYITDEKTGISYTLVGDVYIPNLVSIDTNYEIGMWGQRHREYLKQYHKVRYYNLLTSGKLNSYLHDIDVQTAEIYNTLVKQLAENQGITEQLKADDMMAWVQAMNNIANQTREIVYSELIYN